MDPEIESNKLRDSQPEVANKGDIHLSKSEEVDSDLSDLNSKKNKIISDNILSVDMCDNNKSTSFSDSCSPSCQDDLPSQKESETEYNSRQSLHTVKIEIDDGSYNAGTDCEIIPATEKVDGKLKKIGLTNTSTENEYPVKTTDSVKYVQGLRMTESNKNEKSAVVSNGLAYRSIQDVYIDESEDSESDSSSSSSSSSSDSEEEEKEGEHEDLEENRPEVEKQKGFVPENLRTKGELYPEDLPPLEDLKIHVDENVELVPVGKLTSIVGVLAIIQANLEVPPLNDNTILFLEGPKVFGQIFEVFGPVSSPWYSVRFNSPEDMKAKGAEVGQEVYCAPADKNYTNYVFVEHLKRLKGSDASWKDDNEPPEKYIEYSDDEQERQNKSKNKAKNRQGPEDDDVHDQLPGAKVIRNSRPDKTNEGTHQQQRRKKFDGHRSNQKTECSNQGFSRTQHNQNGMRDNRNFFSKSHDGPPQRHARPQGPGRFTRHQGPVLTNLSHRQPRPPWPRGQFGGPPMSNSFSFRSDGPRPLISPPPNGPLISPSLNNGPRNSGFFPPQQQPPGPPRMPQQQPPGPPTMPQGVMQNPQQLTNGQAFGQISDFRTNNYSPCPSPVTSQSGLLLTGMPPILDNRLVQNSEVDRSVSPEIQSVVNTTNIMVPATFTHPPPPIHVPLSSGISSISQPPITQSNLNAPPPNVMGVTNNYGPPPFQNFSVQNPISMNSSVYNHSNTGSTVTENQGQFYNAPPLVPQNSYDHRPQLRPPLPPPQPHVFGGGPQFQPTLYNGQ